ncbi:MAG TPA: hypothetical protein VN680_09115 [Burkholderiaceae bacterium]|jgi:hypothetical protein|nr:hypothetical protein [Burkholderiaceae bacterium]
MRQHCLCFATTALLLSCAPMAWGAPPDPLAAGGAQSDTATGPGLQVPDAGIRNWPRAQARLGVASATMLQAGRADATPLYAPDTVHPALQGVSLFGDYYFLPGSGPSVSGFRATGGVLLGSRNLLWSTMPSGGNSFSAERRSFSLWNPAIPGDVDAGTVPYVGLGYTTVSPYRDAARVGWGFSADLGVMALSPRSTVRFGQGGGLTLNTEGWRDYQFTPVLQVGASYSF